MLNDKVYQGIFDEIIDYLPDSWQEVVVYLEHGEDSYSYSFYVKENGKYIKCYDIKGISENKLYESFARIEKMISVERVKMSGDVWSNMTMVVSSSGKMITDFDYTDLSLGNYSYKKSWKKKYLK